MLVTELRLGNYVEIGLNVIFDAFYSTIEEISNNTNVVLVKDGNTLRCMPLEVIKPIPLTEEWLLKFGFKKELDSFYRLNKSSMIEICFFDDGILVTNQSVCLSNIKYLNQLQNLYFALTGEELTIKQ